MSYYTYGIEKYALSWPGPFERIYRQAKKIKPVASGGENSKLPKALNLRSVLYGAAGGSVGGALGNTMYNAQKEVQQPYTMYNNSIPQ